MKLLDKFRSQPEWQSADPAVRLSAIRDLPDDASTDDLLAEIGRQDPDPQVRREAVARLLDLDALLSIAEAESDDTVRSEALAVVRELVVESTDESTATKGLAGIRDERDLVTVARAASLVSIARAALGRLTTARAMGTVARRATHAEVGAEALSWLVERGESDELVAVAAKAEKKAALQAFDRLAGFLADSGDVDRTRDVLTQLSRQARDKAVQRRARSAIEQLGGGGVTEAGVAPATGHDGLCRDVERLAAEETDLEHGRAALDRFVTRWSELAAPDDEALASRFAAARTAAEARLEALEQSIAEARRQTEERHAAVSARVELCERVLALPGDADDDTLAGIRATWDALPPAAADGDAGVEAQLVEITRRFEQAVAAHPERRERHGGIVTALDEAEKLLAGLEQQLDPPAAADGATAEAEGGTTPPARVPRAWAKVTRGWRPLVERIEKDADAAQRAILAQLRERHASLEPRWQRVVQEAQATRAKTEETNLRRLEQKVAKIESVSASDKLTLVEAERQLRGVRRLLSQPGPVPGEARDALSKKLKQLQTTLAGRLRELKEFADWQRWANLGIQEQLCRRMEALTMLADDEAGNAQLAAGFRDIMAEWRKASDVPKAQGDALWERFKKAHDAVHPRVEQQLGVEAGQREANQATLEKLVEEAETLSTSSDWLNTVRRITELQAEWKAVGAGPSTRAARAVDTVPRGVQRVLRSPEGRPRRAQEGLGQESRAQAGAVRAGRGAGHGGGPQGRDSRGPEGPDRVEVGRPRSTDQVRHDLAAVPHGLRRCLRAGPGGRARRAGRPRRGARGDLHRSGGALHARGPGATRPGGGRRGRGRDRGHARCRDDRGTRDRDDRAGRGLDRGAGRIGRDRIDRRGCGDGVP